MEGIGVFPQLYVLLPRLEDFVLAVETGYNAIASLDSWFTVTDILSRTVNTTSNSTVCHISEVELLELLASDWEVIFHDVSNKF